MKDVMQPDISNIQISEFFTPDTHDCAGMVSGISLPPELPLSVGNIIG